MQRFVDGVGFLYFMFALLIIALTLMQMTSRLIFFVIWTIIKLVFTILYKIVTCGDCKGKREEMDQKEIMFQDIDYSKNKSNDFIMDLALNPLIAFYNRSNKELEYLNSIKI